MYSLSVLYLLTISLLPLPPPPSARPLSPPVLYTLTVSYPYSTRLSLPYNYTYTILYHLYSQNSFHMTLPLFPPLSYDLIPLTMTKVVKTSKSVLLFVRVLGFASIIFLFGWCNIYYNDDDLLFNLCFLIIFSILFFRFAFGF